MKISILLPTRERPKQLRQMLTSAKDLADEPDDLEVVFYVDDDDRSYDRMYLPMSGVCVDGPRLHRGKVNLSEKWNQCWQAARGDIFMHAGDDLIFRTQGWDSAVRDSINTAPGKLAFVWANDRDADTDMSHFGTHGFIHRNWTGVTGRFVPPYFVSDFNDTWFNDVAKALGVCRYLDNHLIEHMHYVWGKAEKDTNTLERLARHEAERPQDLYYSTAMQAERKFEVIKLREAIKHSLAIEAATK